MKIEFVSDVVCPWCIIGLKSLDQALARIGDELGPIGKTLERQVRLYAVDRAQATQRSLRRARNPRPDGPGIGTG